MTKREGEGEVVALKELLSEDDELLRTAVQALVQEALEAEMYVQGACPYLILNTRYEPVRQGGRIASFLDMRSALLLWCSVLKGRVEVMQVCPICGSDAFIRFRSRDNERCERCGSLARHRVMHMFLTKHVRPQSDWRVLHLAPETYIAPLFMEICNDGYDPVDINPKHYAKKLNRSVRKFNLVVDAAELPSNHYDLVVHSHVLEHIPANITLVAQHLQRAVKPGGYHLFAIPIWTGTSREDMNMTMPEAERKKHFGHPHHIRRFGRDDFDVMFGPVLGLTSRYTLEDYFTPDELLRANVARGAWVCSGTSVFMVPKN